MIKQVKGQANRLGGTATRKKKQRQQKRQTMKVTLLGFS